MHYIDSFTQDICPILYSSIKLYIFKYKAILMYYCILDQTATLRTILPTDGATQHAWTQVAQTKWLFKMDTTDPRWDCKDVLKISEILG